MPPRFLCNFDSRTNLIAAVTRGLNMTIAEGLVAEGEQFARMVATNDIHEGLSAWAERRVPVYSGT